MVRYVFDTGQVQGNWLRIVGNISVLNHEGEPVDITLHCTARLHQGLHTFKIYAVEHLNLSQITIKR